MSIRPLVAFLHALAAGVMVYGYRGLSTLAIDNWIRNQKGGHFQFLTIQGYMCNVQAIWMMSDLSMFGRLTVAWASMMLSLATDLFPSVSGG